jgi:hypothetical protein
MVPLVTTIVTKLARSQFGPRLKVAVEALSNLTKTSKYYFIPQPPPLLRPGSFFLIHPTSVLFGFFCIVPLSFLGVKHIVNKKIVTKIIVNKLNKIKLAMG